jgi:hypothetical protein
VAALGLTACDTTEFLTFDFLKVEGKVVASDGQTGIPELDIQNYRWIVSYRDGSTVSMPFDAALRTNTDGAFQFSSGELDLRSGTGRTSCNDVCVETNTTYESVCVLEDTYLYDTCTVWGTDYFGNPVCLWWETEAVTECVAWEERSYSYCSAWAEDCTTSYAGRNIDDIAYSQSEIDYRLGSSLVTTASEINPEAGYSTLRRTEDQQSLQWLEEALFITPVSAPDSSTAQKSSTANLTQKQREVVEERNANAVHETREVKEPRFSRTRAPSPRILFEELDTLTETQKAKLEEARNALKQSQSL